MKTKVLALLVSLSISPLGSMDALALTGSQVETNIRSVTTGCPDFTIAPPATGTIVYASSYGVSTSNTGGQNYTNFLNALAYCKAHQPSELVVAPGTYEVGDY